MAEYSIQGADLRTIENNLSAIYGRIDNVAGSVNAVDSKVETVYSELASLAQEFRDYVLVAERQHNLEVAETRLVKIRQELETKFGHYSEVRRTTTGILQADDLNIVKKDTISNVTEEMMLTAPGYWLAPCLVALAAWINDQHDVADRALAEAIKRNDEKTSLLFGLICRRAGRKPSSLKWIRRYMDSQDEENLDRNCIVILDAFASGLFGKDTEGLVQEKINAWLEHLEAKPGFVEQQKSQWATAIKTKQKPIDTSEYTYLKKYSHTWPLLEEIMEGAHLHEEIFNYLTNIFEQQVSTDAVKDQLDVVVDSLVTNYDDEEIPFRKDERLNQLVIDYNGDMNRAQSTMQAEQSTFDVKKDFTQLLTDAAMDPEGSHSSPATQKFSIALSKEWVYEAYQDVVAANRMKVPNVIEVNVDSFNDTTVDGENEAELLQRFNTLIDQEKANTLAQLVLTMFDQFCLVGGAVIAALGVFMVITGNVFFGLVFAVAGAGLVIRYFSRKKQIESQRQNVEQQFEQKRSSGQQIIRATLAEIVDFRMEFDDKDAESEKVLDFIEGLGTEQYINSTSESNRRIMTNA